MDVINIDSGPSRASVCVCVCGTTLIMNLKAWVGWKTIGEKMTYLLRFDFFLILNLGDSIFIYLGE